MAVYNHYKRIQYKRTADEVDLEKSNILLLGPTGTGKSDWALSLAETLPVEIVSCDSAQVFRGLDIGTAKTVLGWQPQVPFADGLKRTLRWLQGAR